MAKLETITGEISSDFESFVSGMKQITEAAVSATDNIAKSFAETGKKLESFGKNLSTWVTAPLAGLAAFAVKSFGDQEDAEQGLIAALKLTGEATAKNVKQFGAYASSIQKVTKFGDEQVMNAMTYGKTMGIQTNQLEAATKAAVGLSAAYGMDLDSSMQLVAKAQAGNTAALQRYGIQLDEGGSAQQKFSQLLEIGAKNFSLAEAQANTMTGSMKSAWNAIGDLAELIGARLAPFVKMAASFIKDLAERAQKVDPIVLNIAVAIGVVAAAIGPLMVGLGKLMQILPIITKLFSAGSLVALKIAIPIAAVAAIGLILAANWEKVTKIFNKVSEVIKGVFASAMEWIQKRIDALISIFPGLGRAFTSFLKTLGMWKDSAKDAVGEFVSDFTGKGTVIGDTVDYVKDKIAVFKDFFTNSFSADIPAALGDAGQAVEEMGSGFFAFLARFRAETTSSVQTVKEQYAEFAESSKTMIASLSGAFNDGIMSITEQLAGGSLDWKSTLRSFLVSAIKAIIQWAINVVGITKMVNVAFSTMSTPYALIFAAAGIVAAIAAMNSIPALALGGVVTKPTMALIGERGPEVVMPLNSAQGKKSMASMAGGSSKMTEQTIIFAVNGREMAREVVKEMPSVLRFEGVMR